MPDTKKWVRGYISSKENIEMAKKCRDSSILYYLVESIQSRIERMDYKDTTQEDMDLIVQIANIFRNFLSEEKYHLVDELMENLSPEKDYMHNMFDILIEIGKEALEALIAYGFGEMKWGWYVDEYILGKVHKIEDERLIHMMLRTLRAWSDYNDTDELALEYCLYYLDRYNIKEIEKDMRKNFNEYHPMVKEKIRSFCKSNMIEILCNEK